MKRELTCIICPRGCMLTVDINGDTALVSGNACPKGKDYGINECIDPVRTVTSIMRVCNSEDTMVSVKTAVPIRKGDIRKVMEIIRNTTATAPIRIGDVLIENVCGSDIIATKDV